MENRKAIDLKVFQTRNYHPKIWYFKYPKPIYKNLWKEWNLLQGINWRNVEDKITKIYLDDSFGTYIEIINKENELLWYRFKVYLIKYGHIGSQYN